jgi:hypothetical protein
MRTSTVLAASMLLVGVAAAPSPARADHDDWRDQRERRGERSLIDDRFDYARLQQLVSRFDLARANNRYGELHGIERELVSLLNNEVRETERELAREQREAIRAQRTGNRRVVVISDNGRPKIVRMPSRANKESVDAQREASHLDQMRTIAMELRAVSGRQDPAALDYRRARMVRLLQLGGREIQRDQRQLNLDERRSTPWYRD